MAANDVNLTVLDGGFGGVGGLNDSLIAIIGCATAGTDYAIVSTTDPAQPITTYTSGPLPNACAAVLEGGGGSQVLMVKVPTITAGVVNGASATPLAVTATNTSSPIQVTTAAHGLNTGDIATITGVTGQTGANGTFVITKVDATKFTLNNSTSVGAWISGGSVQPKGINEIATGTSVVTVTGTIVDTTQVVFQVVTGGTIGVAGITFRLSIDGGLTYGATQALGTANTYNTTYAGTLNFAAGTLVAADAVTYSTQEPLWQIADVQTAITAIKNSTYDPVGFLIVGNSGSSDFTSLNTTLTSLETNDKRYTFALINCVDYTTGQTDAAWTTAQLAAFAASSSKRIATCGGFYRLSQTSTGTQQRRPLSWPVMARLISNPLQVSAGRVKDGPLLGVSAPAGDGYTYHDERVNPGLTAGRFLAAKTILGKPGEYVDSPAIMTTPGSTFSLLQYRRGMDKACRITRATMLDFLQSEVRVDATTGHIDERDAATIEAILDSALATGIVNTGNVSAAKGHVSRTDNILVTQTLTVSVNIVPLGYLNTINVTLAFINPLVTPL